MNLSTLSIILGLGLGLPQIYGLANPQKFAASVRKFPRNVPIGIVLMFVVSFWLGLIEDHTQCEPSAEQLDPEVRFTFVAARCPAARQPHRTAL